MKSYILEALNIDADNRWKGKYPIDDVMGWQNEGHKIKKIISIKPIGNKWAYKMRFT